MCSNIFPFLVWKYYYLIIRLNIFSDVMKFTIKSALSCISLNCTFYPVQYKHSRLCPQLFPYILSYC